MKEVAEKAIETPQPGKPAEVPAPDPLEPKTDAAPSPQKPVEAVAKVASCSLLEASDSEKTKQGVTLTWTCTLDVG